MRVKYCFFLLFSLFLLVSPSHAQETQALIRYLQKSYQITREKVDPYLPPEKISLSTPIKIDDINLFTRQANVSIAGQNVINDAANEPSIAVNPLNPKEIVIGWRQFDNINSNFRQAGISHSIDGGETWTPISVLDEGVFRSDPVLGVDGNGTFYYNSLTVDFDNNGQVSDFRCDIFRSNEIGEWDRGTFGFGGDKQWMVIDPTPGIIPNVYSYWTRNFSACFGNFTRSIDGGNTYEECGLTIATTIMAGTMDVDIDGALYIGGWAPNFQRFFVMKSSNAPNKEEALIWDFSTEVNMDGPLVIGGDPNPGGLLGQVEIGIDRSNGLNQGNIYILSTIGDGSRDRPSNIVFARSTDGGLNWDDPIRINDDNNDENYQWMGTMSVAPNGRIDVAWLDTRDNPASVLSSLYYTFSEDGGLTWSGNIRLSDSFDPHVGWPSQNKMGDYFDMQSDNFGAHLAWTATFNGEQDVYYSYIQPNNQPTNTKEFAESMDLHIFPNPFSNTIQLKSGNVGEFQLKAYNLFGQLLYTGTFRQNTRLNTSDWGKGIYLLEVKNLESNNTQVFKILK